MPGQRNGHEQERVGDSADGSCIDDWDALLLELRGNAGSLWRGLKRSLYVEWQRAHMRAVDAYFRAAFFVCLLGFALAASIAAALLIVAGVRDAFAAYTGAAWVGSLGAGLVVVALTFGSCLAVRAHLRRDLLKETERKLAEPERPPERRP